VLDGVLLVFCDFQFDVRDGFCFLSSHSEAASAIVDLVPFLLESCCYSLRTGSWCAWAGVAAITFSGRLIRGTHNFTLYTPLGGQKPAVGYVIQSLMAISS